MSAGNQSKNFAFVPTNGNDSNVASQKFIRGHAMRETLRHKALGTKLGVPHQPIPYRVERFRVGTSHSQMADKSRAEPKPQSDGPPRIVSDKFGELVEAGYDLTQYCAQSMHQVLPEIPSPGSLDPFDSLPIKFERQHQMLLSYYDAAFTQNDLAFNGNRRMILIASSDPAWLHTAFALVALSHGFSTGIVDGMSLECLFNRGKALYIIKQRLDGSTTYVTEGTIGAIASLANIELSIGSLLTCSAHIEGLKHLLRLRGWSGPHEIPKQFSFLRNLVAWTDLAYAGVTLSRPQFQPIESESHIALGGANLLEYTSLPAAQLEMFDLFENLRYLSEFQDGRRLNDNERKYFQSTIFSTQYQLLSLNGKASNEMANNDTSLLYHSSTRIGLCLYINMVLRRLPYRAVMHYIMAKHMKSSLESPGDQLIFTWESNLELLLWILFMGATATTGRTEYSYFVRNLLLVTNELRLLNLESFIKTLELTVWSKTFCLPHCNTLWEEISVLAFIGQQFLDPLTHEVERGWKSPMLAY